MELREAIERSRIPRINWKKILGKSLNAYVRDNCNHDKETIIHSILLICKKQENAKFLYGWRWLDVVKNVRIGVSARIAEIHIYRLKGVIEK